MTDFDRKKAAEAAIEATSGVLNSIKRQRQHMESEMERMAQLHDDLTKIEGWVRKEMAQYVQIKQQIEKEEAGG